MINGAQANPSLDCLWIYAYSLSHAGALDAVMGHFAAIAQRLDNLANIVRHEYKMTKAQEVSLYFTRVHSLFTPICSFRWR
jgi:hypothetical protein